MYAGQRRHLRRGAWKPGERAAHDAQEPAMLGCACGTTAVAPVGRCRARNIGTEGPSHPRRLPRSTQIAAPTVADFPGSRGEPPPCLRLWNCSGLAAWHLGISLTRRSARISGNCPFNCRPLQFPLLWPNWSCGKLRH